MGTTSAREEILGDIGRALKGDVKLSSPDARLVISSQRARTAGEIPTTSDQQRDDLIRQFESELTAVGGRFHRAATPESALQYIKLIASDRQARIMVGYDGELIESMDLARRLEESGLKFVTEREQDFIRTAAVADIGLTGVDYALADTGTLVLVARKGHARSISLLPPVHVAVLKPAQIISGLSDLFPLLRTSNGAEYGDLSSAITFITGPSRTADIELTLVVGVHGPQELHVVLLEAESTAEVERMNSLLPRTSG